MSSTIADIPHGGPDCGAFLSVKPCISISQEMKQGQVLLREVEDDVWLPRDTQDMNANKVVEYPPRSGVLDASAFLVRKSPPLSFSAVRMRYSKAA